MNDEITIEEMTAICDEVWESVDAGDIFDVIEAGRTKKEYGEYHLLDMKLRDLFMKHEEHPVERLVAWLRYSYNWREATKFWLPLRNSTYSQAAKRHGLQYADDVMEGL